MLIKKTHVLCPLFNNTADDLLYWYTQKKRLISGKMNSYKGLHEKYIHPYNHMSAVVETSFFRPKNVRFFNSKLGLVADVNRTVN